jgi:phosphoserine phosphatase RsbU/P
VTTTTSAADQAMPTRRADGRSVDRVSRSSLRRGVRYETSLILSLSLLVVGTGLAVSLLAFRGARESTAQLADALFQEVSNHAVTRSRGFLERAGPIVQLLSGLSDLGLAIGDRDRLARQLTVVLRANEGVSWISYSDEAGEFVGALRTQAGELRVNQSRIEPDGRASVVEHNVMPDGSWRPFRTEADSAFDPRVRPYYIRAKQAGRIVWPPPYVFYEGVPGVTCATPLYNSGGTFRGVLTVDFNLATLSRFVDRQSLSPNSRLFIMAPDGTMLAHPAHRAHAAAAERAAAEARAGRRGAGELLKVSELNDPLLAEFVAQLSPEDRAPNPDGTDNGRQFAFRHSGTDYYAHATTFTINGDLVWIVGAMAPQSDFLAAVWRVRAWSAAASLGAMLVAVIVAMLLARRVSGPIRSLVSFMDSVGAGDLSGHAKLGGAREFRQLSDALERMLSDLRDRSRLRGAMAVAMQVQQGLLPPRPPKIEGLDVDGFSVYCDETGGDYFDYLLLKRDHDHDDDDGSLVNPKPGEAATEGTGLLVAVGDVVGHGIGSALVMAGARGVLHSRTAACGHLGELMTHLNQQLVPDMMGARFVTMLLWYVDPRRRTACWANAGHDPAMVYDPANDTFTEGGRDGIPLGIEIGDPYHEHFFGPLTPGQVMVLGTDGVWETMNAAGEMFGRERLRQVIRRAADGSAAEIAAGVRRELDGFRGEQHQRDDVTLVVIKLLPIGERT